MIEEAFSGAANTLNQTVLGSVLIIGILGYIVTVVILRGDLKKCQDQLTKEREDHQKTREEHMVDVRNLAHVASSVDGLKAEISRLTTLSISRGRE